MLTLPADVSSNFNNYFFIIAPNIIQCHCVLSDVLMQVRGKSCLLLMFLILPGKRQCNTDIIIDGMPHDIICVVLSSRSLMRLTAVTTFS